LLYLSVMASIASAPELSITLAPAKSITTSLGSFSMSNCSPNEVTEAKKRGPFRQYTFLPSSSVVVREWILACSHANTSAEMIIPAITAMAKSSKTVTTVTVIAQRHRLLAYV
jgi:hypothetical protein